VDFGITVRGENLDEPPINDMVACKEDSTRRRSILHIVATTSVVGLYIKPDGGRTRRQWKSVKWITDPDTLEERPEDMKEYVN
jgi:hypothetical protein